MADSIYDGLYIVLNEQTLLLAEESLLPRALGGDYEEICKLLFILGSAIQRGVPLPPLLSKFLSTALLNIAGGKNASEAFNIKRKKGQKDTRAASLQAGKRAFLVEIKREDEGMTLEEAVAAIAEKEGVSEETIKHAWKAHHKSIIKI